MMQYVSFRSAMAFVSLFISTIIGRRIIQKLQVYQIGEIIRNLDEGQLTKKGTLQWWCHYHYSHTHTYSFVWSY